MKNVNIIAVLLLCVAMLLTFAACGKDKQTVENNPSASGSDLVITDEPIVSVTDAKMLEGTWLSAPINYTEEFNSQLKENLPAESVKYFLLDDFSYKLTFVFNDGNYAMMPESDSVDKAVDGVRAQFYVSIGRMYIDAAEQQGAKVEDVVEAIGYKSLDELIEYTLTAFDFEQIKFDIIAPLNISGTYRVENGKLLLFSAEDSETVTGELDCGMQNGHLIMFPPKDSATGIFAEPLVFETAERPDSII